MKQYFVRSENWDSWLGGQIPTTENVIVEEKEIERLSQSWGVSVGELMNDVDEVDDTDIERIKKELEKNS